MDTNLLSIKDLPEDCQDIIYTNKHQLEFKDVMKDIACKPLNNSGLLRVDKKDILNESCFNNFWNRIKCNHVKKSLIDKMTSSIIHYNPLSINAGFLDIDHNHNIYLVTKYIIDNIESHKIEMLYEKHNCCLSKIEKYMYWLSYRTRTIDYDSHYALMIRRKERKKKKILKKIKRKKILVKRYGLDAVNAMRRS